jgi:aconitate hydratase
VRKSVVVDRRSRLAEGGPDLVPLSAVGAGPSDRPGLPVTVRILLENVLRHAQGERAEQAEQKALERLADWRPGYAEAPDIPFRPARVLLQDFTGVPAVVDLAALRDAVAELGGDASRVDPLIPADLVIDHSVQVDRFGTPDAFAFNVEREYERNGERYALLRWAQGAFRGLRVVPPGTGIVHQVNLEYLASVVTVRDDGGGPLAYPDSLVGTDSHTTMINGLGVLGFGVGGIEAEAAVLGQALWLPWPRVVGVRLSGRLPIGSTATDLVLTVTEQLRELGVVESWVEFDGDGLEGLPLADRATISNMSPEFGATATLFPIDEETLRYLQLTGRPAELIELVERYAKAQGLWREPGGLRDFDELLELDLGSIEPSLAGPRRPQDRVPLGRVAEDFAAAFPDAGAPPAVAREAERMDAEGGVTGESEPHTGETGPQHPDNGPRHGSVVIAAITSCTNTSNPTVMVGAGLLARNAVARGLRVSSMVKTSLAPGSRAVTTYLDRAGLIEPLEKLGFGLVGYGCTTCIGNSGPLDDSIATSIEEHQLVVAAVLSGNRNFEGRIHPLVRAAYLASPPLVVAYGLAGRVDIDLTKEPIGRDAEGKPVMLSELWPKPEEIADVVSGAVDPEVFKSTYADVFDGDDQWRGLPVPEGDRFAWDEASTYIARPPFLDGVGPEPPELTDIEAACVLVVLGDSITTDHISPAGSIPTWSPAGQWLIEHGVAPTDFNSYGARRGHHEVMARGTFGNVRLRNALAEGKEGPYTTHLPSGELLPVYEAARRYADEGVPLILLAGREYGSGSSRDWAAKGPALLGIRAAIAESFERIHRSNLLGMGILPLQFSPGDSAASLGLTGRERFSIRGIAGLAPGARVQVEVEDESGRSRSFQAIARIDGEADLETFRQGGLLPQALRRLLRSTS